MRLLVDSNIITYILRDRAIVLSRLTEALKAGAVFVSSDVVDYEIRRYLTLKGATRQMERYEALARDWLPTSLTRNDWRAAANLWAEIHRTGRSRDDRDLLIAISALKEQAIVVTNNTRHFEGLGVPLIDWVAESA
jgi:tRNA(fMet)-specific endonuclease VapC